MQCRDFKVVMLDGMENGKFIPNIMVHTPAPEHTLVFRLAEAMSVHNSPTEDGLFI